MYHVIIAYLLRWSSIHCAPPQALYSIFSGSTLQPLPSQSSTNSRSRTASPAAYRAAYRFLSRTSLALTKSPPAADAPETCAFAGSQAATESFTSQHICSFPLQVKITSSLVCGLVSVFPGEFFVFFLESVATWQRRCFFSLSFPPRGAV